MPTYLLTHHFPKGFHSSSDTAAAAQAWFERLGTNRVGGGNPAFEPRRLGSSEMSSDMLAHTLISTDNLEAAIALAEAWPLLPRGGGVEIRELTILQPSLRASG
jgi:hypothetical protein